ncbi:hypothetical protein GGX14DRAFT_563292 [Mycena pura]|uniref:Uncharacterized protein n=1 Tax=Mycena pura TaxID=153505 RepID=A0AAD6VMU3_9AGAR|nr:hypothetical protein GGX14DRAFT_563292 [Mycena pura]
MLRSMAWAGFAVVLPLCLSSHRDSASHLHHSAWRTLDINTSEFEEQQLNIVNYVAAAQFTLLFYDYFLTFEWEVSRCTVLEVYHEYFITVIQITIGVMLVLRTYALYERNNRVLCFMLVFGMSVLCISIWSTINTDRGPAGDRGSVVALEMGCAYAVAQTEVKGLIIDWSTLSLFDCMIFLLTLYKTLRRHRPAGLNLLTVLMRDGCIYFGVMVISNLSNIFTYAFGTPATRGLFNTTTNIISSLMTSRLMLNIRDPVLAKDASCDSQDPGQSAVQVVFSTYLESMPARRNAAAEWV